MEGNTQQQRVLLKVKKRFALNLFLDIVMILCIAILTIGIMEIITNIPTHIYVLIGITMLCIILALSPLLIYLLIYDAWKRSRKQIEVEVTNE